VRGDIYREIRMLCILNSARSNALLTDVALIINGNVRPVDFQWKQILSQNLREFGLVPASGDSPVTGYGILSFDPRGDLKDVLSTVRLQSMKLRLYVSTVTNTTQVIVSSQMLHVG
jgi:hypothetical protein